MNDNNNDKERERKRKKNSYLNGLYHLVMMMMLNSAVMDPPFYRYSFRFLSSADCQLKKRNQFTGQWHATFFSPVVLYFFCSIFTDRGKKEVVLLH